MNSMAYDLARGVVFDPFGGLRDLKERKLRVTDPERFQDDPLRVLRAAQFCSRFELVVEPESFELMKTMVEKGDLNELSSERVLEEWRKLLTKSGRPSIGIELLRALGAVKKHFPELGALIGVEQEREWHPEGDVWMHSMMVVDKAAEIIRKVGSFSKDEIDIVMFGALCHDFGKPLTTETIKGKLRTLGHEEAGEMPAREFLRRMKVSNDLEDGVVRCVREHLKPAVLYTELMKGNIDRRQYANAIRKVLKRVSPLPWRVLLAVCEADHRGRAILGVDTGPYEAGEKMAEVVEQEKLDEAPTVPLIQGRDVLALAKSRKIDRRPDRWVGDAIRAIEALRDEGEITTREQALAALQKMEF
jgi:tRNA nucleotidyltransferase (CCA-adding enzyme)